ncbi:phosphonopyruvate decarboxylase [Ruminococcaceae bacterium OttesenSCG-928-L11]|nr:phosphonopyruvate decarboxylase [Ruminococcaceae bacterium OttesenSCG-928-L11]
MRIHDFMSCLTQNNIDFFTGVPDSQLKELCDFLMKQYDEASGQHIIAHNEGGCVGLAAGSYLSTGSVPCVYMQNSGIGNAINPIASLTSPDVYGIPMLFVIGWRGEPGTKDEPQHVYQGKVTLKLLKDMDITPFVIGRDTETTEVEEAMQRFQTLFAQGKSAAFVIEKGAFPAEEGYRYRNVYSLKREEAIEAIVASTTGDIIVSTTGKISRELFEIRERRGEGHGCDFLTVGSMGHSAMIALGVALQKPKRRVWCIDGDGAVLMHMGALSTIGARHPHNLNHVVLNNEAHETVGGMPTSAGISELEGIAASAGYRYVQTVESIESLQAELSAMQAIEGPGFLQVKVALGSRDDLGRPTTSTHDNKREFMDFLKEPD